MQTLQSLATEHGLSDMDNSSGQMRLRKQPDPGMFTQRSGDTNEFFKPLSAIGNLGAHQGVLSRDAQGRVLTGGIALPKPRPVQDGGVPFDGTALGTIE